MKNIAIVKKNKCYNRSNFDLIAHKNMVQRLKRWESPRKQGRNDKGKGGTARARQLRKREQMLRQKLKTRIDDVTNNDMNNNGSSKPKQLEHKKHREREITPSLFYC